MSFKSTLKLDSKFFDRAERQRAFGAATASAAQNFRQSLKQKMIDSEPAGRRETIAEGDGFRATFRRSKRGQRPAIQTRNLLNSIYARRISDYSAETVVAAEYADELQDDLGRQVMTEKDVEEAGRDYDRRTTQALLDLL